ncbi:respiratory burst oxidase [Canna indica]|uniref:Respiratory burst oxidase n=1 Tax=Canna indica TaxID=4628 RepID=A0AAQ3LA49_9LILI|nr:respiratory burst oxidase [Canna indica]
MVRTVSSGGGSSRKSGHRRIADILAEEEDSSDESLHNGYSYGYGGGVGGGMLPIFLNDQSDLVEVMLELDEESMVVRSVTPTSATAAATTGRDDGRDLSGSLSRSSSTASRIRRKFAWLLSPSRTLADMLDAEDSSSSVALPSPAAAPAAAMSSRDARRIRARLERTRSGAQRALKGLRFISQTTTGAADAAEQWRRVEERFSELAEDGLLSRDDFGGCIGMVDSKEFAVGIFDALARRQRQKLERITKEELYDFWLQISDQSFDARLQIFFDMADTNVDGRLTREEVQELIVLSASANKLSKLKEQAEEYAALIMEELDPENLGYIELWQLEALLLQRDTYMNYSRPLSTASAAGRSQNIASSGAKGLQRRWFSPRRATARLRLAARENWQRAWVLLLWLAVMAGLFAWKFTQYRHRAAFHVMGYCLPTAKGAAETLKLNMALVLLPVCRNTLTWLRSTRARLFVPFDDNITFHKMIATAIVVGILLHAGNHLTCDFPRLISTSTVEYEMVARYFGREKPTYGSLVTGVEGVTGIAMVVLMTISFTLATHRFRKNGAKLPSPLNRLAGFNAFWYSHHLLAVVYLLLLVHGFFVFLVQSWYQRTTWMYISVPLLLYVGERTLRAFRSKADSVKILKVSLLPGGVLTVTMSKPNGFRYRSGQYIFLQCPTISPFEWFDMKTLVSISSVV